MSSGALGSGRALAQIPLLYPVRVGVTGHRAISEAEVGRGVRRAVERIRGLFTLGYPLEWVVVSSLARGADRVVAHKVLGFPNASLEAILPLAQSEYELDFDTPADLAEFRELLSKASSIQTLCQDGGDRSWAYMQAGRVVVDKCDFLFAVWDGKAARGRGGTADVVDYALACNKPVVWVDTTAPDGPASIVVGRSTDLEESNSPDGGGLRIAPLPADPGSLVSGFREYSEFLSDPVSVELAGAIAEERQRLVADAVAVGMETDRLEGVLAVWAPWYCLADQLAIYYQRRHVNALKLVPKLAAAAITIVVFQTLFVPALHLLIGLEIVCMLSILALLWRNRIGNAHGKWLSYRYFAERLRPIPYLALIPLEQKGPSGSLKNVLPYYSHPSDWYDAASKRLLAECRRKSTSPLLTERVRDFVLRSWFGGQLGFHEKVCAKNQRLERRRLRLVKYLFGGTLIAAAAHMLLPYWIVAGESLLLHITAFCAVALPAWGASVHAVAKQMQYGRIAARSKEMCRVLGRLMAAAKTTESAEELGAVLVEGATIMGVENSEWWVLLSFEETELMV